MECTSAMIEALCIIWIPWCQPESL